MYSAVRKQNNIMIKDSEQKILDSLLYENLGVKKDIEMVSNLGEEALFVYMEEYDWDGVLYIPQELSEGMFILPTKVAEQNNCDLATALTMFWSSMSLNWLDNRIKPAEIEIPWFEFSRYLTDSILTNRYRVGKNKFLGLDKYFSEIDVRVWRDRGIPEILYSSLD